MDSQKPKTPQEELEELLRQAGGQAGSLPAKKPVGRAVGDLLGGATGGMVSQAPKFTLPKLDTRWGLIGGLALILLGGTIFFMNSVAGQKNSGIIFELNQPDVKLTVGNRLYGSVNSGFKLAVRPGEYKVSASKDGFLDLQTTVLVAKNQYADLAITLLNIPELNKVGEGWLSPRLSNDGTEITFLDPADSVFKTRVLAEDKLAPIFRGSFVGIKDIVWSSTGQAAIVQIQGTPKFANTQDNRAVQGRYIPLGERPSQAATKSNGITTWLFDDANKTASGWQPVWLNENIRQVAFSADGSQIIYIYEAADGEYSLITAQPDGLEWERVITNMPRLNSPRLIWGPDDRYLMIVDGDKVYSADLLGKVVEQVFSDWIVGSDIAFDPSGNQVAYFAKDGSDTVIKIYDLLTREAKTVSGVTLSTENRLVWVGTRAVLVAGTDQNFKKIDVDTGASSLIPFSGITLEGVINQLGYSQLGHVLMVETSSAIYYMKV